MIYIGVDLHRRFCYMTALEASGKMVDQRQVANAAAPLLKYFGRFDEPVEVAVESCSFWPAFVERVGPLAERIVLVHPQRVKAIASAKLKNDRVDSQTLAHLLRTNLLPESWQADRRTREWRQLVRLHQGLVGQRTQWKNRIHSVLHEQGLRCEVSDLFGRKGRAWLAEAELPPGSREVVGHGLELIDALNRHLKELEQSWRPQVKADPAVHCLTSIPGIGAYSALVLLAEIGEVKRFASKRQLYSYAGLIPRIRQSAGRTRSGGITRAGSPRLRWILIEAAITAVRCSPAARGYFERLKRRKPPQVARVALARKLLGAVYVLLRDGVCFNEEVFAAR